MEESVADLLRRLRFVGQPVETLYLNEVRVRESFISQLGAIESFTRTAKRKGKGETPVVKVGAEISSEADITWNLSDPITQVLVLRAALEAKGLLHSLEGAKIGSYITFTGIGMVSCPNTFDGLHRERLQDHPGLYEMLEAKRAEQERIAHLLADGDVRERLWLLTMSESTSVCAAILDHRLKRTFVHYMHPGQRWEILALLRQLHDPVPMLAPLHIGVKW